MAKKQKLSLEELLEQALVKEEDQPYAIPENWVWCSLGNTTKLRRGASPRPINNYITDNEDGINWIKIGDTGSEKYLYKTNQKITSAGAKKSVYLESGSLILSNSMSFGRPYILGCNGCIHDGWLAITFYNKFILKEFMYYVLLTSRWYFEQVAVGTAVRNLNIERVAGLPFPLPPLPEQQRIVALIESLFEKLDRAKELAQNALDSFENRKSAILHKAFTGELTSKWREENNQPYNDLLKIILDYYTNNSTTKDSNNIQKFQRTVSVMGEIRYSVWYKCSIGAIGTVCNGSTPSRQDLKYWGGDIPWVSSGEVRNNVIDSTNERITADGYNNSSVKRLKAGTVLIAMIGEGKTRGQTSILNIAATINQNVAAIDLSHNGVSSKFMWYWLQYQYKHNREAGNGSGPKALNCQRVRELGFILPPLLEQKEIVRILDNLLENEQKAKELCDVIDKIDRMKKSILARAFRGELSTNDPAEESAAELLKEVLKEKL